MRFKHLAGLFLAGLAMASAASADTVVLKNGDHLTGTIEVSDGHDVTLKTDYAGEIKIQWASVTQVTTTEEETKTK